MKLTACMEHDNVNEEVFTSCVFRVCNCENFFTLKLFSYTIASYWLYCRPWMLKTYTVLHLRKTNLTLILIKLLHL